jgi:DNA-binding NarL/FixJ family response regulator
MSNANSAFVIAVPPYFLTALLLSATRKCRDVSEGTQAVITPLGKTGVTESAGPRSGLCRSCAQLPQQSSLRVLLVDEHKLFGDVIQSLLREHGVDVVGVAASAEHVLLAARLGLADVAVVCVWAGSLLEKTSASRTLVLDAVGGRTGTTDGGQTASQSGSPGLTGQLTPRERQVLGLLAEGASNKDMARKLALRPNTVRTHVQNLLDKLGVHSRLAAVTIAARHGATVPDDSALSFARPG